jgi:hypothetical protein
MIKSKLLTWLLIICFYIPLHAEEGLWIPMLLEKYAIKNMNAKGLKLSAQDIYSINQVCLKDAVVIFGNGCTGELISQEGLVLTNHHCGFPFIQSHSSLERDYISNGFWAMSKEEELPNQDISVTFLIRMEDVSEEILKGTESVITEQQRQNIINENIERVREISVKNTGYKAIIKPFYYGNEYYLFIYQEYMDVRLVGAPPAVIGNFGVDSDNWVWPRHTGDFSIFRIYADENNNPAEYSPDNIPYKPRKFLSVSLNGYKENDFTMVIGYPGTTTEYLISDGIKMFTEITYPAKVKLREKRMDIISKYMNQNDEIRIQYAYKYRNISNLWKKWQGVVVGINKYNAVAKKESLENEFITWVNENPEREKKYGEVIPGLKEMYRQLSYYVLAYEYSNENVLATEIIGFASKIRSFFLDNQSKTDSEKISARNSFMIEINKFFKDYNQSVDLEVFKYMMRSFYTDIDTAFHPGVYKTVKKKYKSDFERFAAITMSKTIFTSRGTLTALFESYPESENQIVESVMNDPVSQVLNSYSSVYNAEIKAKYDFITKEIGTLNRMYLEGLREMDSTRVRYPDANFTMRVSYGKVEGYEPAEAVKYRYYSTLDGIVEKSKLSNDYAFPSKLFQLYLRKDFGPWKNSDGKMPVCFIASNHTSGGNSGSPVLDANGHLIGLNFDRNWEGTMSDIWYDPSICRNICVDIRYILFIIDKFANAGYLIDEMDLIWD